MSGFSPVERFIFHTNSEVPVVLEISANQNYAKKSINFTVSNNRTGSSSHKAEKLKKKTGE